MASEDDAVRRARLAELKMLAAMAGVTMDMDGLSVSDINRAIAELSVRLEAIDVAPVVSEASESVDGSMRESLARDMRDSGLAGRKGTEARAITAAVNVAAERCAKQATAKAESDAKIVMGNAKSILLTDYQAALLRAKELAMGENGMDFHAVTNKVVAELARKGVTAYTYTTKDGRTVHVPVDVGIRRAIVNANSEGRMNQTLSVSERTSGLVEVSSTANCRESHASWQGKVYSVNGDTSKYPDFKSACHVGDPVIGFGGYNCGHAVRVYSEKHGKQFKDPLDGTGYTTEQARALTAKQRSYENEVRKSKRAAEVLESKGLDSSAERARVRAYQEKLRNLTADHPGVLRRQSWREDAGVAAVKRAANVQSEPAPRIASAGKNGSGYAGVSSTPAKGKKTLGQRLSRMFREMWNDSQKFYAKDPTFDNLKNVLGENTLWFMDDFEEDYVKKEINKWYSYRFKGRNVSEIAVGDHLYRFIINEFGSYDIFGRYKIE